MFSLYSCGVDINNGFVFKATSSLTFVADPLLVQATVYGLSVRVYIAVRIYKWESNTQYTQHLNISLAVLVYWQNKTLHS